MKELPGSPKTAQIFRFVRHHDAPAYIELGWINHRSLEGTHHGQYSTLLEWTKSEPPAEPDAREVPIAG